MPLRFLCVSAVVCLSTAAFSQNDNPEALIRAGHIKQAKAILESKLKQNPKEANALWQMAWVKMDYKDLEGAIAMGQEAIATDDKNAKAHCLLAEAMGTKAQQDGVGMFEKMRLARGVRKEAERALELNPKYTDCMDVLASFYEQAPGIVGGDKNKAAEMLDRMVHTDPVAGNLKKGNVAANAKDWTKTEEYYKAAYAADPKRFEAVINLGSLYSNDIFKKYDLAEKHSREAIQIDPKRVTAYSLLVQVLLLEKKDAEVEQVLAQAEKNVPDNLNPYFQAGRILLVMNRDYPKAERYFCKYLTQEPEPNMPPLANAHFRLGQVLDKQGRKPEAISEQETALRLKPDLKVAQEELKRLKQ
ncbi:MAG: Tetratricopeptide 2 repeat protein [Acidobacteriales bacterium]|nr:Tetratricopeptide 2 repeat protein [Terriglobales bacterium]